MEDVSTSKLEGLEVNKALLDLIAKSKWNYKIEALNEAFDRKSNKNGMHREKLESHAFESS